jgi:hypothetical protein
VRLAGRDILIDQTPETTLELADAGLTGESNLYADIIRIRHDLTDAQWDETLLHELLHFVWHLTPLPHLAEEHEETVIRSIAPWLAQVYRLRLVKDFA